MEHICGTSRIGGFRFSLYPMTDDFISVIKSALKKNRYIQGLDENRPYQHGVTRID